MIEEPQQPKSQSDNGSKDNGSSDQPEKSSGLPKVVPPPKELWVGEAPVGSITSPSQTGKYRMAIRDYARNAQIDGSLVALDYDEYDNQGNPVKKTVLCQVSSMALENKHHENPILKSLLRREGRIPGLSGFADNKEADLLPMDTVVAGTNTHELPRNIPPTGTDVRYTSLKCIPNLLSVHRFPQPLLGV